MKIIEEGHVYEVENFADKNITQTITFLKKQPVSEGSTELEMVHDGTTNEELLLVMIDRLQSGNVKVPSRETALSITKLEEALMWLEKRTKDRLSRGVEGTNAK